MFINLLSPYMGWTRNQKQLMLEMVQHGVIAVETLLELAISKVGKIKRSTIDGQDFIDGSDAKKATVYNQNGDKSAKEQRQAWIGNIVKNGVLRIVIADPKKGEMFFFKVPQKVTKTLNNKRNMMNIPFSPDGGKPSRLRPNAIPYVIWNECRVDSFEELCS